jgi:hypothetical protein
VNSDVTAEDDLQREKLAGEAWERIKQGNHWQDWRYIADRIYDGRQWAKSRVGLSPTDRPMGSRYAKAFGEWLDERRWARELDKTTRAHLAWYVENRTLVEAWRDTLVASECARLNHPSVVKRRYEAAHRLTPPVVDNPNAARLEPKNQRLQRELEKVSAQLETANRRLASGGGSLFDLKRDSADDIARVVIAAVPLERARAIQSSLSEEIKRAMTNGRKKFTLAGHTASEAVRVG